MRAAPRRRLERPLIETPKSNPRLLSTAGLGSTLGLASAYCRDTGMRIEIEQEQDGRWLCEIPDLPGVMVYGSTREEAVARVKALALRVLADRLEHGESVPELVEVFSIAA